MESFNNLGYTLGGNAIQGCGVGRFGYNPGVNPPYATMRKPNTVVGNSSNWTQPQPQNIDPPQSNWNGWQYNPGQSSSTAPGPDQESPANASFSQGNHSNWRNLSGQSPISLPHPVITTGASPFQLQTYSSPVPQAQPPMLQQKPQSGSGQINKQCLNVPYWTGKNDEYNQAPQTPLKPADAKAVEQYFHGNQPAQQDQSLGCHVQIGAQGDQPVVYTCGGSSGKCVHEDSQANSQQGSQAPQAPMEPNQGMSQGRTYQQQPQNQCPTHAASQPSENSNGQTHHGKGFSPCGNCRACQYQSKGLNIRPGQPRLVRGPRAHQQKQKPNTASSPEQEQGDNAKEKQGSTPLGPGFVQLPTMG